MYGDGICFGLNCAPAQYLRMGLNIKIEYSRGNKIKMKSLMWVLIQYDWCSDKKEKIWTKTHRGKTMCGHREKTDVYKPKREEGVRRNQPSFISDFQAPVQ